MRCRHENMAHLYTGNMLTDEEKRRFEAHLNGCDVCKAIVREDQHTADMYRQAPLPSLPSGFEEKILRRAKNGRRAARSANGLSLYFTRRIIPAAAIIAAAMLFVILYMPGGTEVKAAATSNSVYAGMYLPADDSYIVSDEAGEPYDSYLSALNRAYASNETEKGM